MKNPGSYFSLLLLIGIFSIMIHPIKANNDENILNQVINLPDTTATIYQLFEVVTEKTGYFFMYDSRLLDNEQISTLNAGDYTVREAIYQIIKNPVLSLRISGNHILIYQPTDTVETSPVISESITEESRITVEGTLLDLYTKMPIQYGTVGVEYTSIGTITNQNGDFRINIPDSLKELSLIFSHVGYEPKVLTSREFPDNHTTFYMEPKVISIQEVVVRLVNPQRLLREMLDKRNQNYSLTPVYFTSFYREGVERRKGIVNLTEAVFKIYKSPYTVPNIDQAKLLKMRKISNQEEKDTIVAKIKSGIQASLLLDIIKNLPDFLSINNSDNPYHYIHSDITIIDNRVANIISFEQKKENKDPLFKGQLYIDNENDALLMARFEINPQHINKATNMYVEKKSRNIRINTQQVYYTVSYKQWNGIYYIHHIRGDLHFKVKNRRQLFSSPIHTWFEMVTCDINTEAVTRFNRSERLPQTVILSDVRFNYDADFWGNFNIILPEEKLTEAISKIRSKIEESDY